MSEFRGMGGDVNDTTTMRDVNVVHEGAGDERTLRAVRLRSCLCLFLPFVVVVFSFLWNLHPFSVSVTFQPAY